MSYCTNPEDDGRCFPFIGEKKIRSVLADTNIPDREKDELLRTEQANAADYYNWVFDRRQERITKCQTEQKDSNLSSTSATTSGGQRQKN